MYMAKRVRPLRCIFSSYRDTSRRRLQVHCGSKRNSCGFALNTRAVTTIFCRRCCLGVEMCQLDNLVDEDFIQSAPGLSLAVFNFVQTPLFVRRWCIIICPLRYQCTINAVALLLIRFKVNMLAEIGGAPMYRRPAMGVWLGVWPVLLCRGTVDTIFQVLNIIFT